MTLVRTIPRHARVAQGFHRLRDMAEAVENKRLARARRPRELSISALIWRDRVAALQRIVDDRRDLRSAARRAAGLVTTDNAPVIVVAAADGSRTPVELGDRCAWRRRGKWKSAKGYIHSTRRVEVPAVWVVLRLLGRAMTNIDHVISRHDPAARLRATPHWMERLAARVLTAPAFWLTPAERSYLGSRRAEIEALRRHRARRRSSVSCGPTGAPDRSRPARARARRPAQQLIVPPAPWVAAALDTAIRDHMDKAARWLGDVERCLAWARWHSTQ